jgi:hypothetical protein
MELLMNRKLQAHKQSILAKWQTFALSNHENLELIKASKNQGRFSNPAAYVTEKNTGKIFDWLINDENNVDIMNPLEEICRLRAVQNMKPSQALKFIPVLKQIIRDEMREVIASERDEDLRELDKRIDEITLLAFDIYSDCRDRINQIKINEMKRLYGRDAG